jgi:hypothetical protein
MTLEPRHLAAIEDARPHFREHGWGIVRGLFGLDEVSGYIDHYMAMRAEGPKPGDYWGLPGPDGDTDPLLPWPRLIHMHRWDERSLAWMLDPRLRAALLALFPGTAEPLAVQTMCYFKPAGGRGQALHQDQRYLHAAPGNCAAAWLALDRSDEETGCLELVAGSGHFGLLPHGKADLTQSFTDVGVTELPEGAVVVHAVMDPGDVVLFNGNVVHGSSPNRSKSGFRRALIGHYLSGEVTEVDPFYLPAITFDGQERTLRSPDRGPDGLAALR